MATKITGVDSIEDSGGSPLSLGGGGGVPGWFTLAPLYHVRDEEANNTAGGGSSATTQHTRVLNTEVTANIDGASLSSNQVTLPAGTYFIIARAPAHQAAQHKVRWRNVSDSVTEIVGSSVLGVAANNGHQHSHLSGEFTISAEKTFELQHYITSAKATDGLGVPTNSGDVEVYAEAYIWKIDDTAFKPPARVASTVAGTLASDFENGDTIDGVTLVTGDRILIKDQSSASENGVYTVEASGSPTRAVDFDSDGDLNQGVMVPVVEGDVNATSIWMLTTAGPFTVGSTSLAFEQVGINTETLNLNLGSLREIASNDIPNTAATPSGGLLTSDTTPAYARVNGATDKALRVIWVATNSDEVQFPPVFMPPDLNSDLDITIHLLADMSGATDTPTIDVQVFDGVGDTEMGGATAAITSTLAEVSVTISAADLSGHPLGFLNVALVPGSHTSDDLRLYAAWIEYTKKQA